MSIFQLTKKDTSSQIDLNRTLERLIDTYGNDILRISYMYLKDIHKAEDVFQEVFLRVYKNYHNFKGESSEKTWLISITMNVCRDFLKSSWFRRITYMEDSFNENEDILDVEDTAIKMIENEELLNKVMKLPPKYREVILLYYYEEMDVSQISEILSVPSGTVRSRLFRAREMLKINISEGTAK